MRIAVIGSGIGGMSAAWLLSPANDVDVYEVSDRLGGHTHTLDVTAGGLTFPVDTGFMVFNRRTYPNLTRFFEHLGVDAADADMSFSVSLADEDIEWSGTSLDTVFAQRKNVTNPRFLQMLADVLRLSRNADRLMSDPTVADLSLGELMEREGYSKAFTDWYLIPMGAAIWSTPPGDMVDYPALTFLHFCDNHGLLHILGKPAWLSVKGGAKRYLDAVGGTLSGEVFTGEGAERVERTATGVRVHTANRVESYDQVVFACHPPQTREILGEAMSDAERAVLSAFEYWPNDVVVHSDESFLPRSKRAWASWNWYSEGSEIDKALLRLTYRINTLQSLPEGAPSVLETLNRDHEPAEGTLLAHLSFDHPMYSREAVAAQAALPRIQGADRVWFAGAWTRYGFHEDGILSGVRVAEALGATLPWGDQLDPTRTMTLAGAPVPLLGQTRKIPRSELPPEVAGVPEQRPAQRPGSVTE
ncbi:MAG: FAD-dependent oxidoreductase [Coriobacteriia bacterium]|nr:FAD-dependent oxidoreductase [Coriobacteriia bacterium]